MKNDLLKKITCRYCKNKYCECDFEEALKKSIEMINKDYKDNNFVKKGGL